ncbi:unnamed protein product [Penicillium salamii]|uniref:Uncharacterized protein n=1 Tax=Penicillium salamii TaxID=1612424 RepID=A0A9W4JV69_9EURO|nr:unnamed protein product [Penicillium salamii]CAG8147084.1 unnamed protein product [Penicillium salamii]CAG8244820.1 unnamed protein product [Penicillium salamii]CAG8332411.1 unnamed protein product [Penicillium salamii]CAG8335561.1 unnamed protein product [Penicillium salamii]
MAENPRPRVSQEIHHGELHANCLQRYCTRCRAFGHTLENCWHVQHEVALIRRLTHAPPPPKQGQGQAHSPGLKGSRQAARKRPPRGPWPRRWGVFVSGPRHPLSPRRPCGPPGRESSRSGGGAPPWWPQGVVSRPLPLPTLWRGRPPLAYAHPPPPPRGRSSLAEHRHPCWPVGSAFLAAGQPPSFHRDVLASLSF